MTTKITNPGQSIEWNAGFQYAEWLEDVGANPQTVDIGKQVNRTQSIPEEDAAALIREDGVKNPDAREYWAGFNAYLEK